MNPVKLEFELEFKLEFKLEQNLINSTFLPYDLVGKTTTTKNV